MSFQRAKKQRDREREKGTKKRGAYVETQLEFTAQYFLLCTKNIKH
jgi:hypothetical protein